MKAERAGSKNFRPVHSSKNADPGVGNITRHRRAIIESGASRVTIVIVDMQCISHGAAMDLTRVAVA